MLRSISIVGTSGPAPEEVFGVLSGPWDLGQSVMSKFTRTIAIIVVSIFVVFTNLAVTMASADEIVQYHLNPAKVTDARLHKWRNELSVQITLDEVETVRFEKLLRAMSAKDYRCYWTIKF